MTRKTVPFTQEGIENLPDNKPALYKILDEDGENIYTGTAKRGRVQARIEEHLPGNKDAIPGTKVVVQQAASIAEAQDTEKRVIKRSQPKFNVQHK